MGFAGTESIRILSPNDHFDDLAAWRQNQDKPWNRLRYQLVAANLRQWVGGRSSLIVLDAGGGDGRDARALALSGHNILIIDRAPTLLAEAERSAADAGVADRIRTQQADIIADDWLVDDARFDLVLCHNVLQYLDQPERLLRALARSLCEGGLLSLLIPNPASEPLRQAIQQRNLDAALASIDATTHRNHFYDVEMHLHDLPSIQLMLANAGLTPMTYYGVRCVNDYILDDEVKFSEEGFGRLLALEEAMGSRSPYRDIARLWQIIARKQVDEQG